MSVEHGPLSLSPSAGRRRALDAAVNLVPFIDLLSCCLAFLLITAVWSQNAQLDARLPGGGDSDGEVTTARPWTLLVAADSLTLEAPDGKLRSVAPPALEALLRTCAVGDELTVRASGPISYAVFVGALDAARAAGVIHLDVALDS